jgi:hypothetical protein
VVTYGQSKVVAIVTHSTKIVGAGDGDRTRMASLEGRRILERISTVITDEEQCSWKFDRWGNVLGTQWAPNYCAVQ